MKLKTKIKVEFFKPSGKWYSTEEIELEFKVTTDVVPFILRDLLDHELSKTDGYFHCISFDEQLAYPYMYLSRECEIIEKG